MPRECIADSGIIFCRLIVAGPVAITFYLTWWFVNWVDNLVRPFVPIAYRPETYLPFGVPGSGLIVAVFALTMLGFLTANLIGRTLVDLGERLLGRMPVVRAIYRGLKQVFETLFSGSGSSLRKVGLVEFPSPGMWSIVLISQVPNVDIAASLPGQEEHISVSCHARLIRPRAFSSMYRRARSSNRDEHRGRGDPHHVCRCRSARDRSAEEVRGAGRDGECARVANMTRSRQLRAASAGCEFDF